MFSKSEANRYSRHFRLKSFGQSAQENLKNGRVLVIGAGGLGCPVLQYLAAAGVGTLGIADPDKISLSNLQRQVLYTTPDIGKLKVHVATKRLEALNPEIKIIAYPFRINQSNGDEIIGDFDVIVDTTDNIPARYQINDACIRQNKPLVYGAIFRWEGQVSVFNYENGPTYRCLFPNAPGGIVLSCDEEGVIGVVPGILGTYQALEVIKILSGTGQVLSGKLLTIDLQSNQSRTIKFSRRNESIKQALEKPRVSEVETAEIGKFIADPEVTLLDVRSNDEFAQSNIGGLNIPLDELKENFHVINSQPSLLVLCQTGRRSVDAIRQLHESGYGGRCYNLTEGLRPYFTAQHIS